MTTDNHRTGADAAGHMRARVAPAGLAFVILQLGFALLLLRQFRIVESPSERARLASAGRARMLSRHAWPRSMQRLDAIIENARCAFVPQSVHSVESAA